MTAQTRTRRPYEPNLRDVDIALSPFMISHFGAHGAITIRQIAHHAEYHGTDGWFEASSEDLADITGLSPDQCRRATKTLIDNGQVEKKHQSNGRGMQKCKYRLLVNFRTGKPLNLAPGDSANRRPGDSARRAPGDSARPTYSKRTRKRTTNPPTPLQGGDGSTGQLDLDDTPTRAERDEALTKPNAAMAAAFELWWQDYPAGKTKGNKAKALKAWLKVVKAGHDRNRNPISVGVLTQRLENYRAARMLYTETWAAAQVVGAHPPLMHGSTFINSMSDVWAEEWAAEDLTYWPPPDGHSWEDGAKPAPGLQDALAAEIAAEEAMANGR